MKKFLLSIGAMLLCGMPMMAYDFMEGSLAYNKLTDTTVEVTFKGDKGYRSGKDYTDAAYVIPATVTHDGVTYSVTQIGDGAFYGSPLQTVSIPEGIVTIGKDAFSESGLTAVKLPSTVKEIKQGGFHMCYDLASLELNEGLETLGWDVFNNARALETVTIPGSLKIIPSNAFGFCGLKTVIIKPGVEEIYQAFNKCASLTSVSLPETLVKLDGTFENCTALKTIQLPLSLRDIGWDTFANTAITEITVNEGFENLGTQSLGMMNGDNNADYTLKKVTLPSTIKTMKNSTFNNRRGLTDIIIRATVPPTTSGAFGDYVYNATLYVPATSIEAYKTTAPWSSFTNVVAEPVVTDQTYGFNYTLDETAGTAEIIAAGDVVDPYTGDIVIPQTLIVGGKEYTVTSIGKDAFCNTDITSVKFPATLKEVKQGAFQMCYDLATVELNEGLETLNWDVFNNTKALKSITIPGSVKTIPANAFGSSGLQTVIINSGVESIKDAFNYCENLTSITLPETLIELNGTFQECPALKEIKLPASLRTIGWFTFAATGITELVINEGLETLDMQSLGMMNGDWNADYTLKKVTLPSTLKSIDGMALNNRRGLTHVIVRATVPPTAGTFADYVYNATLCVPAGTADAYKAAAGWKNFSKIVEVSSFDTSKLRYTVGEGANQYVLRVRFNNNRRLDNLTWGYRADETSIDAAAVLDAVAAADKRLEVAHDGDNTTIKFDLISDGVIDDRDVTASGAWDVTANSVAADGSTLIITYEFTGSPKNQEYDFFVPEPDAVGVWLPEEMTVKLSDEGTVLPALVQVPDGKLNSTTNWQASTSNTSYRLDRTKITTPYTLVDDTYNAIPTFVGATGTTYVRYRPQKVGAYAYYESNFMTLNIEAPEVPMTAIHVTEETITAGLNKTVAVEYTYEPGNATYTAVKFAPADTKVATWYATDGLKTTKTAGETTVTVSSLYDSNVKTTFTLKSALLNPVTAVNFGPGTEDGVINVPVRQLIGLKPVIEPADADIPDVTITLSDNGTSKADYTCSTYRVNWWDANNVRSQFYELSGHRPTGDKPAKLHVVSADGNYERDFVVNVIEADRTPRANGYEDGTIILNEEWFGHTNGGLNYFTEDDEIIYQAYEKENPCMAFGATSQYGTIWGGKLIVASKQAQDGGDPLPGGGRLVIADAKTLKRLGSLDNLTWDGISGDGRAVAGATPDKIYVGSNNGIYIVDITDPTAPAITGRIGKEDSEDLYNGQIGDMTTAGDHVFAVMQSTGLIIINVNDDTTTEIADANIQGVTQSADGHVWYATIQNGCSVFVALDHETLKEVDRVTMPAEIGTVVCGWGAWRSTAFHGSPKTNDLWFVTGAAGIMGGASGDYFRYHIGDDPKNIKPFFSLNDVKGINGFGEEVGQMTYGTPKYDDRNNRLIVMAGRKGAASGGYRDHWLHYVDGTTGEITKTFHLNPYYWFQSLPIFPDKHDAEIQLENMEIDMADGAKTFNLAELVDDKDSHNANIRFSLLDTPALMADDAQTEAHADVTLEGKTLTVTPKSAGQHYFTLAAESNGRTVSKTVGVNVKDNSQVGIDAVGAEGSLFCNGGRLFINGFNGQRFHVYSMEGIEVVSFDVDSDSYTFDFGSHTGVYVVTSDNGMSAKVIIR